LFDSARKAETAFYEAFEHADLRAMMEVWDTHSCACIHPMNDRIEGFNAISDSWQLIFESNAQLRFYLTETRYLVEADLAVHQVLENISFVNRVERREAKMLATNVYRATAAGWKMVLHHASPAPGNVVADNLH
jgi:ketosteroid isomerase-like protein|tara:strand:+ start:203 stop:604 length:402 start_codon:yes stop_codon:yes gene_type:complete